MAVSIFYPEAGAGGGNITVDGNTKRIGVPSESFAALVAGAGNGVNTTSTVIACIQTTSSATTNEFGGMQRGGFTFDLTSLGADIASAVIFSPYVVFLSNNLGDDDVHVSDFSPASDNDLINSDYDKYGGISFGSIAYPSMAINQYNDINFNASGIASVNTGGVRGFGTRGGWDIAGIFGGSWISNDSTLINIRSADQTGTAQDPKLTVTHASDTTPPIGTVTVNTDPITLEINTQTVTVTYNETMDSLTSPTIAFAGNTGSFVSNGDGAWSVSDTVWTETFNHDRTIEYTPTVTVSSSGAEDLAGNPEDPSVDDTFAIVNGQYLRIFSLIGLSTPIDTIGGANYAFTGSLIVLKASDFPIDTSTPLVFTAKQNGANIEVGLVKDGVEKFSFSVAGTLDLENLTQIKLGRDSTDTDYIAANYRDKAIYSRVLTVEESQETQAVLLTDKTDSFTLEDPTDELSLESPF